MASRLSRLGRLTSIALMAWSGPTWSAEAMEADLLRLMPLSLAELIHLPVVTASRQYETRDQTPAHVVVVTREQIRERRYKNLANLIEDMPGVDFMRGTKSSQFNQFSVQGYTGPNKLLVMLDGVRIGHPAGGNFPLAENFSLYHAKQVEFLYGPAAALYGADAVAGVINIITDHAGHREGGWVEVGAGNFGSREASFMAGLNTAAGVSLNVGGHWQRSERAPLPDYYPTDFAPVTAGGIAAEDREDYVGDIASRSLYARLDVGENLSLGFYRSVFHSLTSTGDPPATAIYLADSQWITQTDTLYGKYRFAPSRDLSGELVLDYSRMEVSPRAKYHNWYNGYTDGYSYVLGERLAIEQNFNWRLDERHRVQAGLGYQKYYAIETASLPGPYDTGQDPEDQGYLYPGTDLPLQIYDAAFHNLSAYAQIHSEWNARFTTMAGLRLDRHSDHGQTLNPRLGAVWRVNARHVLKALYGEAFRAPSPEESLSSFGIFKTGGPPYETNPGFRIPNFDLEPEKAKTVSLTWDWRPRENLNIVANAYRSKIRNLVYTNEELANDTTTIPGATILDPETKDNAGAQSQTGLDLMAQWRFKLNDDWTADLWGNASWVEGEVDERESIGGAYQWVKRELPYVAERKFKLGMTLRYRDRFTATPQIIRVGDTTNGRKKASSLLPQQCSQTMTAPDRCTTDGYTLVNLHLGWHRLLDGNASLWLDVYNLLDRRYHVAHGSASRTFWDMPQQPRSWMASLEYRF